MKAGVGLAMVMIAGCGLEPPRVCSETWALELGVASRLDAVHLGYDDEFAAAGVGGVVVTGSNLGGFVVHRPTEVDLHGVTLAYVAGRSEVVAVGDGGTIVAATEGEDAWRTPASGTTATLRDVAGVAVQVGSTEYASYTIAVGDDVMVVRGEDDEAWAVVTPPAGGWGELRGVFSGPRQLLAVGLGGVIWATEGDPRGGWVREDAGTGADLVAGDGVFVVGSGGTLLRRIDETWVTVDSGVSEDLIDYAEPFVLTAGGAVLAIPEGKGTQLEDEPLAPREWTFAGARSLAVRDQFALVGEDGRAGWADRYCR